MKHFSVKGFKLEDFGKKGKFDQNAKGLKYSRVGEKRKAGFLAALQHFGQECLMVKKEDTDDYNKMVYA